MKRISLFARDSRDLREKRDGSEGVSSRVVPVAHVLLLSLTIRERWKNCLQKQPHIFLTFPNRLRKNSVGTQELHCSIRQG